MELWEFVLQADGERDLADPAVMANWFRDFWYQGMDDTQWEETFGTPRGEWNLAPWDGPVTAMWQSALHAFRSTVRRFFKSRRCRKPAISDLEADQVVDLYFSGLRAERVRTDFRPRDNPCHHLVDDPYGGRKPAKPITPKTFGGIRLVHTTRAHLPPNPFPPDKPMDRMQFEWDWTYLCSLIDTFWQKVLISMHTEYVAPVCGGCGQPLGLTPKGKRPRAGQCTKCRYKQWYRKQPKEKLRELWSRKGKPTGGTKRGKRQRQGRQAEGAGPAAAAG